MIWLILSMFSSASVALLLKTASVRSLDQFPLFATNYLVALALGLLLAEQGALASEPPAAIALAVGTGILYVAGFLVFRRSIVEVGAGVSASISRLAVSVPVVVSFVVFGEAAGPLQAVGVVLAVAALPLSGRTLPWAGRRGGANQSSPPRDAPSPAEAAPPPADALPSRAGVAQERVPGAGLVWSILLYLVFGLNDTVLKVRTELLPGSDAGLFFGLLFGTSCLVSATIAVVRRERLQASTLLIGVPLGAVNYGTAFFLSRALEAIPGFQAFTLNSVGVILIVVLAGRILFTERVPRHAWLFFLASVVAVVLLRTPA